MKRRAVNTSTAVGTIDWTTRTGGRLDPAERRRLVADMVRVHVGNVVGQFSLLAHLNPGRKAYVSPARLLPPDSPLRTYRFGRALGELDVDIELLFAAALLHDTGLVLASGRDEVTLTSSQVAREVAEQVGLSTAATETLQSAITMHHSPRVTLAAGAVAYLLSAGAAVDVVGLRCWELPGSTVSGTVGAHPREGVKRYFSQAWADEAARVPQGRAGLLRRYGAFTAAIALAPFDE